MQTNYANAFTAQINPTFTERCLMDFLNFHRNTYDFNHYIFTAHSSRVCLYFLVLQLFPNYSFTFTWISNCKGFHDCYKPTVVERAAR